VVFKVVLNKVPGDEVETFEQQRGNQHKNLNIFLHCKSSPISKAYRKCVTIFIMLSDKVTRDSTIDFTPYVGILEYWKGANSQ